jgi:hypothetical protein
MDFQILLLIIDRRGVSIMSTLFTNRRVTHLRFAVVFLLIGYDTPIELQDSLRVISEKHQNYFGYRNNSRVYLLMFVN